MSIPFNQRTISLFLTKLENIKNALENTVGTTIFEHSPLTDLILQEVKPSAATVKIFEKDLTAQHFVFDPQKSETVIIQAPKIWINQQVIEDIKATWPNYTRYIIFGRPSVETTLDYMLAIYAPDNTLLYSLDEPIFAKAVEYIGPLLNGHDMDKIVDEVHEVAWESSHHDDEQVQTALAQLFWRLNPGEREETTYGYSIADLCSIIDTKVKDDELELFYELDYQYVNPEEKIDLWLTPLQGENLNTEGSLLSENIDDIRKGEVTGGYKLQEVLYSLFRSQGITKCSELNGNEPGDFLSSFKREINETYPGQSLVLAVRFCATAKDLEKLNPENDMARKKVKVTIRPEDDYEIGLFDPTQGGGSIFDIHLEKPWSFTMDLTKKNFSDLHFDVPGHNDYGYSPFAVYGDTGFNQPISIPAR